MTPPRSPSLASCSGHAGELLDARSLLPAVREIEHSSVDVAEKVVCLADHHRHRPPPVSCRFTLVALLGTRADPLLGRLNAFVGRHARTIAIAIELVFAVVLAWKGSGPPLT